MWQRQTSERASRYLQLLWFHRRMTGWIKLLGQSTLGLFLFVWCLVQEPSCYLGAPATPLVNTLPFTCFVRVFAVRLRSPFGPTS